ncbi:CDP-diacylglycerol--serine O-phosphatidyltransferase [Bacteroidales bacterium OttesenSCG-928-L03]|nr:CDP-diacylglycerol--serine O-phosphatidyltransferase [Bacteroidales bacterium OttesenSCG-928-L03]
MKQIPNMITCLNLFAGCMACILALRYDNYLGAFIFILLAALFDFLDGFAARMLKAYSKLGAQLDSLADVVSFGAAPGFIIYSYLLRISEQSFFTSSLAFLALLLPIFAAIRLAKFNIDTRQTDSFLGLPVPASGLFWAALIPALHQQEIALNGNTLSFLIVGGVILFSLLMVSELPMFALKFKSFAWKGNEWAFSFLLICLILIIVMASFNLLLWAVSGTIIVYILLSILKSLISK